MLAAATTALLFAFAPSAALAQSKNDVDGRLRQIENDIDTLNRAVYKGETPPSGGGGGNNAVAADQEVRIQQMETDIRNLTGKVEQQSYDVQQLQQRVDALTQDTGMRLDTLEKGARSGAAPMGAAAANPQPGDVPLYNAPGQQPATPPAAIDSDATVTGIGGIGDILKNNGPQAGMKTTAPLGGGTQDAANLYEQGFAEIKREDYPAAEKNFATFLKSYPDHALAPNALYWLGETFYARKQYDKAAKVFAESYQKYPAGPKGADNLLKLGMSLSGMGKKNEACIALGQLGKQYADGPAPVLRRGEQEMGTLGCK